MYVRPMSEIINRHNVSYHSYADDSQLYIQCDNNEESIRCAITRLERCIPDICEWMSGNSLKINQDKTEFIIFSCKSDQYNHLSLNVGSEIIHPRKSVKILGVTLDVPLIWNVDCFEFGSFSRYCTRKEVCVPL